MQLSDSSAILCLVLCFGGRFILFDSVCGNLEYTQKVNNIIYQLSKWAVALSGYVLV